MCVIWSWAQGRCKSRNAKSRYGEEKKRGFAPGLSPCPPYHTLFHLPGPGSQQRKLILRTLAWQGRVPMSVASMQRQKNRCRCSRGREVVLGVRMPGVWPSPLYPLAVWPPVSHSSSAAVLTTATGVGGLDGSIARPALTCCDPEPGRGRGQAGEMGRAPGPDATELCSCPPTALGSSWDSTIQ